MTMVIDGSSGLTYPNSSTQASSSVVLQVVNATYGTEVSSSSSTYSDTGLTASITPKFSTSKILVIANVNGLGKQGANTFNSVDLQLVRNTTSILQFESTAGYNGVSTANDVGGSSCTYLDSPATTSATTYKVQFAADQNAASVTAQARNTRLTASTITLMEIAG